MARNLSPLPSFTSPVTGQGGAPNTVFYAYLQSLDLLVREQAATIAALQTQVETLRVGLNQARQNPTTVYPAITF